jgi:hypothetical protein
MRVGGAPHRSLVALSPKTGAVLPWRVPAFASSPPEAGVDVEALALDRARPFVGGDMTTVDGKRRFSLAALDAGTGAVEGWVARKGISTDAIAAGATRVLVIGSFSATLG